MVVMTMGEGYFAVFDIGTTNVKTMIFDEKGSIVGKTIRELPIITPRPEFLEQNAEKIWEISASTMNDTIEESKISSSDIAAVTICTQRGTVVPVDKDGKPLHNAITWMDTRTSGSIEKLREKIQHRLIAMRILWFKDERPDIYNKTFKFETVDAYFYRKLTGNCVLDFANAAYGPFDVTNLKYSEELSEEFGAPIDKLPEAKPAGEIIGEVTSEAEKLTGLKSGTPVVCGSGDQQCSSVALGLLEANKVKITTGTGTFVDACISKPLFDFYQPVMKIFCLPHALKKFWLIEGVLPTTGAIYRWLRDLFFKKEANLKTGEVDPYKIFDAEAERVNPGSDGLILIPLFSYSMGIFRGLSLKHGRGHLARAILESNGFIARFFLKLLEILEVKPKEIGADGGGMKSKLWRRILADIIGKKLIVPVNVEDTTALGAAVIASAATKIHGSLKEAVESMVHIHEIVEPDLRNLKIYDEIYPKFEDLLLSVASELSI